MAIDLDNLDALFQMANLADEVDEQTLLDIGAQVVADFQADLDSRSEWEDQHDEWMKLAVQVVEEKSWPWDGAANVKYPLLATSAMQFQARAYPTLVAAPSVVKARVIGEDPTGEKAKRAERIGKHMSYQVLEQIEDWDEDMDKLCFILPITGVCFKKVYYDSATGHNCSELILPKDLVINYWTKKLEKASTVTHIMYMTKNTIMEQQMSGAFSELNLDTTSIMNIDHEVEAREKEGFTQPAVLDDAPRTILEQHRWWDLDKDGYMEPYIVTVEYSTSKVLRITPRFEKEGVIVKNGKLVRIEPENYFIKFSFIPNPDGGFYDLGFGALLGPLNATVNTLINQLLDSGTLHNLQAGFISKGIRLKAGEAPFQPGEWKAIQTTGDDLRKGIFPLPTKEPSDTLFKLLGSIVESGQKLASIAEIFVGKMPGQNTPATTTMATIEQGMKVFTAIYKRIYRSLTKEFKRMYKLNKLYMEMGEEFNVVDSPDLLTIGQSDYLQDDTDVRPAADPTSVSEMLRLTKAQALLELIPLGTLNAQEATKRILEAQDQPEIEKLLNQGPPPPDPKMIEAQVKVQTAQALAQLKQQEVQMKMQAEQEKGKFDIAMKQMEMQLKAMEAQLKLEQAHKQAMVDTMKAKNDMEITHMKGKQQVEMANMQHEQKKKELAQSSKEKEAGDAKGKKEPPVTINIDSQQKKKTKKKAKKNSDGSWDITEEPITD
jgi:chaperonin GroES